MTRQGPRRATRLSVIGGGAQALEIVREAARSSVTVERDADPDAILVVDAEPDAEPTDLPMATVRTKASITRSVRWPIEIHGRGMDGIVWGVRHLEHRMKWPVEVVEYGNEPDQVMDVRVPSSSSVDGLPAVVLVHGGFWREQWLRDTTEGLAIDLARRGVLTANVEYRRTTPGGSVGPAEMLDDVLTAFRALRERNDVDGERMAIAGHSAGGHLAALAGARLEARAVISMGGVLDLELALDSGIGDGAAGAMLNGRPAGPWSPIRVAHEIEGLIVVHGMDDDRVPVEHARRMLTAAPTAGQILLDGVGHFEILEPDSTIWKRTAELLMDRLG